jgi:VanZ family protein
MQRARIVLVVAAALAVLLFATLPGQGLWHRVLLNATHGPIFALVVVMLLHLYPAAHRGDRFTRTNSFFAAVGLGVLVEVLQSVGGRPASSYDVMTDAVGAAVGLALHALCTRSRGFVATGTPQTSVAAWPIAVVLAGVALVAWPPLQAARAYADRAAGFPTLAKFVGPRDLALVSTRGSSAAIVTLPEPWTKSPGEQALRLGYDAGQVASLQLLEPSPDWRGYSTLVMDLTNPSTVDVRLTLRIHDRQHDWSREDRLNLPLLLAPGARATVRVALGAVESAPQSRSMDLERVSDILLYTQPTPGAGYLYISRIWLAK